MRIAVGLKVFFDIEYILCAHRYIERLYQCLRINYLRLINLF